MVKEIQCRRRAAFHRIVAMLASYVGWWGCWRALEASRLVWAGLVRGRLSVCAIVRLLLGEEGGTRCMDGGGSSGCAGSGRRIRCMTEDARVRILRVVEGRRRRCCREGSMLAARWLGRRRPGTVCGCSAREIRAGIRAMGLTEQHQVVPGRRRIGLGCRRR